MKASRLGIVAGVLALAGLSLALPFSPYFDPWGWLVWGRELAELDLDTSGGPSWKPLAVMITTLLAPSGDAAPALWLVAARSGWILAPLLAAVLAARLTPRLGRGERLAAGALAAAGVLLLNDPFTAWARQFAGGLAEPLLVAIVLGAVERCLAGRLTQAFALGLAAALLRPEAWPLLGVFALWAWRRGAIGRPVLAGGLLAVALLWAIPDLLGSGSPLTAAERARDPADVSLGEGLESLGRSFELVLWGLWAGAAVGLSRALRDRDRPPVLIAALAAGWIGVVALMAAAGFAGLPRFSAPAAALVCVLGAVGIVELVDEARGARWLAGRLRALGLGSLITRARYRQVVTAAALATLLGIAVGAQGAARLADLPGELRAARAFDRRVGDLRQLTGGPEGLPLLACGSVATSDLYTQTTLAWLLERPIAEIGVRVRSAPERGLIVILEPGPAAAAEAARERGEAVASSGPWTAYAVGC